MSSAVRPNGAGVVASVSARPIEVHGIRELNGWRLRFSLEVSCACRWVAWRRNRTASNRQGSPLTMHEATCGFMPWWSLHFPGYHTSTDFTPPGEPLAAGQQEIALQARAGMDHSNLQTKNPVMPRSGRFAAAIDSHPVEQDMVASSVSCTSVLRRHRAAGRFAARRRRVFFTPAKESDAAAGRISDRRTSSGVGLAAFAVATRNLLASLDTVDARRGSALAID